ncbi:MAG: hypothetical protein HY553_14935 [Elusimicrobia bacterium]|nr:hypothetical protein [Elusimicrobiota bacterium]
MKARTLAGLLALAIAPPATAWAQSRTSPLVLPEPAVPTAGAAAVRAPAAGAPLLPQGPDVWSARPLGRVTPVLARAPAAGRLAQPPAAGNRDEPGPPYRALPRTLPEDYLEHLGFVEFEQLSEEESRSLRRGRFTGTPVGSAFRYDGVAVGFDSPHFRQRQAEAFLETAWARLPPGAVIRSRRDALGREHWDYPVGATFIDSIRVRAPGRPIFEYRILTLLAGGEWAFGTYSHADPARPSPGERLRLERYEGMPPVEVAFGEAGAERSVRFMRTNLKSCQACHFSNTVADYQYRKRNALGLLDVAASRAATGPSGFVPTNPGVRGEWAKEYERRHGAAPFADGEPAAPLARALDSAALAGFGARLANYIDQLR